jgi:hypothetical protein
MLAQFDAAHPVENSRTRVLKLRRHAKMCLTFLNGWGRDGKAEAYFEAHENYPCFKSEWP